MFKALFWMTHGALLTHVFKNDTTKKAAQDVVTYVQDLFIDTFVKISIRLDKHKNTEK